MRSGTSSARRGVLLLAFWCAIWCSPGLSAQQQPLSAPLTPLQESLILDSLRQFLTIKELCSLLGPDLQTWPQQIADLQATLKQQTQNETLSAQRESQRTAQSQADLAVSEAARQRASDALEQSQAALTKESTTFGDYKKASESAQSLLNQQLAQERAHRLFTDYSTWAAIGCAAGAVAGATQGKTTSSALEGAGIGAGGALVVKLAGDLLHWW